MRKYIASLTLLAVASSSAMATDYYWRYVSGWWGNWSNNFQTEGGSFGNPGADDNIIFNGYDYYGVAGTSQASLVVGEKTVNDMIFEKAYVDDADNAGSTKGLWISVNGSEAASNVDHPTTLFNIKGSLYFKNSVNSGSVQIGATASKTHSLMNIEIGTVGGDSNTGNIYLSGAGNYNATLNLGASNSAYGGLNSLLVHNNVYFDTGQLNMNAERTDTVSSIDNPDVDIKGVFYYNTSGSWGLAMRSNSTDAYVRLGGLQTVSGGNKVSNSAASASVGNTYLVFNNAADTSYSYWGWMREYNNNRNLNLIMAGAGEQTVYETSTGDGLSQFMRGEVFVKNGTFQMGTAGGEVSKVSIEGGRFSAYGASSNIGELKIANLDWKSGSLLVNFDDYGENCDLLIVSGSFNKLGDAGQKYLVELDLSLALVGESYKIVSWADGTTDFVATDFISNEREGIGATFEIVNNELWATITQVPEPATFAGILGAMALGIVVYRRRK